MNINQLITEVKARQITLWVDNGKLQFKGPKGAMDTELKQHLGTHKADLISLLSRQVTEAASMSDYPPAEPGALSFSQQRLLFMSDTFGTSTAYNMPSVYQLQGQIDVEALQQSLDALAVKHDALRTCFVKTNGEYRSEVVDAVSLPIELVENEDSQQAVSTALSHLFDLSEAPLANVTLIKQSGNDFRLVLNMHHAISDGWSVQLLWRELWAGYNQIKSGASLTQVTQAAPATDYADFVGWQNHWLSSDNYQSQSDFWQNYLSGANELIDLPLDHPRPAAPDYLGKVVHFELPEKTVNKLERFNQAHGSSAYISLLSALYFVLFKYTGQTDICIGTPVANRKEQSWESVAGFFANVVALRHQLDDTLSLAEATSQIRDNVLTAFEHQEFPFEKVVERLQLQRSLSYSPLFQVMFNFEQDGESIVAPGLDITNVVEELGVSKFDLTVTLKRNGKKLIGGIEYATALFNNDTIERFCGHFCNVIDAMVGNESQQLAQLSVFDAAEKQQLLNRFDGPVIDIDPAHTVHQLIADKAQHLPQQVALKDSTLTLTYAQLMHHVGVLAAVLDAKGVRKGDRVGVSMDRGVPMVVSMLAVMSVGAAYVPVDVNFPESRKQLICEDAELRLAITTDDFAASFDALFETSLESRAFAAVTWQSVDFDQTQPKSLHSYEKVSADDLAYLIYTSGSTGKPKGVMVSHGNVVNLFAGLNESLAESMENIDGIPTFRALTSISFDISVLELFWTLSQGFKVIVEQDHFSALVDERSAKAKAVTMSEKAKDLDFSMFYFASDQKDMDDKYFLLREGATFADNNGFSAVWIPERHFHEFGGQFPNPSVAAAAVSVLTKNIEIRSGSCVLPLHNPIRVAEEWSMVDNLSNGRAAMAFASGWHFNDFVLAPDNFENRHQLLKEGIDTVRKLWAGEKVSFIDGKGNSSDIEIHPRPKRAELPIWITAAANPATFKQAGEIGANVLTHFLGQSAFELKDKIAIYRQARADNGHDADAGKVTLMLHTYLTDDYDRGMAMVDKPFKDYLRTSINLLMPVAKENGMDTKEDLEAVVEAGFQRYAKKSALFGTPESCLQLASDMADIGVNEIGCLIDFGVAPHEVVKSFEHINRFKNLVQKQQTALESQQEAQQQTITMDNDEATHIQCTPSYAQLLLGSETTKASLKNIRGFLVGGEPLTPTLAEKINDVIPGSLFNMYGPTETTVWSAVNKALGNDANIGLPIANTRLYVLDAQLQPVPTGVKGELYIAGLGVTKGYWKRPDLNEQNFLADPFSDVQGAKLYRTGDLVRRLDDGRLVFSGRIDNQVKVRGYRIELDEIKTALASFDGVEQAAVIVHHGKQKEAAILAYVLPDSNSNTTLSTSDINKHLKTVLPDYMLPSALFVLQQLPYTPNGKLDLKALPTELSAQPRKLVPVANDTEAQVSQIWQGLLNIEQIGTQESFFELGGHSLLLGKMQQQILDKFAVNIEMIELFKFPTIASLAVRITESGDSYGTTGATENKANRPSRDREAERSQVNQIRNQMRQRNRRGK
jgi:natural product biosynthesis luciferase-like monooxygenase protein